MNAEMLALDCAELHDIAAKNPAEMEVIVEMLKAAGEKLCQDEIA